MAVIDPRTLGQRLVRLEQCLEAVNSSLADRIGRLEQDQGSSHHGIVGLQGELELLRDGVLGDQQRRLDRLEEACRELGQAQGRLDRRQQEAVDASAELQRLRDELLPAAVRRSESLVEQLARELAGIGSLVERMLLRQPLPAPYCPPPPSPEQAPDRGVATGLLGTVPLLVDAFRGSEEEIRLRLERYPALLSGHAPVLDLGSGRGELLALLGEAGISATGIEGDAALVQAARRRGLQVLEGDVLAELATQADGIWGAVTANHLLEHLAPVPLLQVLQEVHRILRPGGLLLICGPNAHSLRVGASLYWLDPTHQHPLLPETVQLYLKACGFVVERCELLHPFPQEQLLSSSEQPLPGDADPALVAVKRQLDRLCRRLDDLLNAPRDFAIHARRPAAAATLASPTS